MSDPAIKPRRRVWRRLWAFLLSLVAPGLGQAFNREYQRGLILALIIVAGLFSIKYSGLLWRISPLLTFSVFAIGTIGSIVVFIWTAIDAFRRTDQRHLRAVGWVKRYAVYLAFILGWQLPAMLAQATPGLRPFNAASESMLPTLELGDNFFVVDGYYRGHDPKRGDLIVFKLLRDPSIDFIKRIVGLPGDRLQMRNGVLYINEFAVKRERVENYLYTGFENEPGTQFAQYDETMPDGTRYRIIKLPSGDRPLDDTEVFVVPPGHYFVLGDNRDNSADSRDPRNVGYVPAANLVGKAVFIYISLDYRQRVSGPARLSPILHWERIGLALD